MLIVPSAGGRSHPAGAARRAVRVLPCGPEHHRARKCARGPRRPRRPARVLRRVVRPRPRRPQHVRLVRAVIRECAAVLYYCVCAETRTDGLHRRSIQAVPVLYVVGVMALQRSFGAEQQEIGKGEYVPLATCVPKENVVVLEDEVEKFIL